MLKDDTIQITSIRTAVEDIRYVLDDIQQHLQYAFILPRNFNVAIPSDIEHQFTRGSKIFKSY